ncbi:MAG: SH3 domain-containing protein [Clostridia bacterium]|nr:SH3 domain-containing protein [Clostridia bacterium]
MICQKCNHILSGSESFCPDCGNPCTKEKEFYREPESPSVIFSGEKEPSSQIFSDEPVRPARRKPKEKKSRAGLYLAVTLCAVILGTVMLAGMEFFEITPVITALFSADAQGSQPTEKETTITEYNPESGIVTPQVNYKTSVAYVTGDKGQALRKGPDSSYGQTDTLSAGSSVHIVGGASVDSKWVYVYVPDKDSYGWVDDSFLSSVMNEISVQNEEEAPTSSVKE